MADFERLKLLGLLEERKQAAQQLRLKCEYLRDSIRDYLPRHEKVEDLRGDLVAFQALDFASTQQALAELMVQIRAIQKDLGV